MATDLRRRVTNLERGQGPAGPWCACAGDIVTIWHADGEPAGTIAGPGGPVATDDYEPCSSHEGAPCETCGKPVRVITLTWDDGGLEAGDA